MKIRDVVQILETLAPLSLQESYDNAGLLTGEDQKECSGILVSLDATEEVIDEAIMKNCNMVVSHHPIIFRGLKKITGKDYVQRTVIKAIKNDIALYAIHTNLDNVLKGVNNAIALKLGLKNLKILSPKEDQLKKLYTFVPVESSDKVRVALFAAGAGHMGKYSECSFNAGGFGTFKGEDDTNPYVGKPGDLHKEKEIKMEVIFPCWLQPRLITALKSSHPYEEVAYDIVKLENKPDHVGSGLIGELESTVEGEVFLNLLKERFDLRVIKHTTITGKIKKVAVCGGAGSFLISNALSAGADAFVTADLKYHEYFDAEKKLLLVDIGHYESEQFTINLLQEFLEQKIPTFAVLKTEVNTNPVRYFF